MARNIRNTTNVESPRKLRFGKDIVFLWKVLTNNQEISLEGRDLYLQMILPMGEVREMPFEVENTTIKVSFRGRDHERRGVHFFALWENYGKDGQTVVDKIAIELVCSTYEEDPGDATEGLDYEVVDLGTSAFALGIGGADGKDGLSAYELAIQQGFVGTLDEWLESLKGKDGSILYPKVELNDATMHLEVFPGACADTDRFGMENGHLILNI